jgi:hypothetical protein
VRQTDADVAGESWVYLRCRVLSLASATQRVKPSLLFLFLTSRFKNIYLLADKRYLS